MRIDLKKDALYKPPAGRIVEVDVPPITFLAVDGVGDPNVAPEYSAALETLYTTGYAIRAALKARTGDDFVVGPLEGLWWADDPSVFAERVKSQWRWTMLIPLPVVVEQADIDAGLAAASKKKPDLPHDLLRVELLREGRSLQTLHIGPYDDEGPTLAELHDQMRDGGLTWNGPHHEIYLGDPRKAAPHKLRTILRQPVATTAGP